MKKYSSYPTAISGYYSYKVMTLNRQFTTRRTRVDVIGETDKTYRIRLKSRVGIRGAGDEMFVRRRNVVLCQNYVSNQFPVPVGKAVVDTTGEWWQN